MTSGEGEVEQNGEGSLGIVRFAGGLYVSIAAFFGHVVLSKYPK